MYIQDARDYHQMSKIYEKYKKYYEDGNKTNKD